MKFFFRLFAIWLLLGCAQAAWSQTAGPKIDRVDIKFVGPATVSEQFIRVNIRVNAGDTYKPEFHAGRRSRALRHRAVLQHPRHGGPVHQRQRRGADLHRAGAPAHHGDQDCRAITKSRDSKIKKKITVKVGEPLDEQKLFTDVQDIKKLYEKYGYPDTKVKYVAEHRRKRRARHGHLPDRRKPEGQNHRD